MDAVYFFGDESFVWNENKAKSNTRKHGVSFEEACEVFFDPFRQVGEASSENEYREFVLGFSLKRRLLFVVYVERGMFTRIISARKATNQEKELYEEG